MPTCSPERLLRPILRGLQISVFFISLFAVTTAGALESDAHQPVSVLAERAAFNPNQGIATYTGNVEMEQGSLKITAHKVIIYRQADGEIEKIIAEGQSVPVHLQQQPNPGEPLVQAYGMSMEYQAASQQVTLTGQARLENGRDSFSGERIHYQMQSQQIQAWGQSQSADDSDNGRVRIMLLPKTSPTQSADEKEQ